LEYRKREDFCVKPELNVMSYLKIIDIKCKERYSIGLMQIEEVYGWGWNICGEIGDGSRYLLHSTPIKVNGFNNKKVVMISCVTHIRWHSHRVIECSVGVKLVVDNWVLGI
jgi:alpha-tubulin suppressor-like RCC1 family protein